AGVSWAAVGILGSGGLAPAQYFAPGGDGLQGFGGDTNGSGGLGGYGVSGQGGNAAFSTDNPGDGGFFQGGGTPAAGAGGTGLYAQGGWGSTNVFGAAAEFYGDVSVFGNLSKSGGSFRIDHPLDP